jgi:hypothetical protein
MPYTDIGQAVTTDMTGELEEYSVRSLTTDAGDKGEYRYSFPNWSKYLGYYKQIPELRAVIDCIATWTVGKGYTADPVTESQIIFIRGFGKDTFNSILENLIRTYYINGDSFAEIIRDDDGNLMNLKVLDPSTITIISEGGVITKYEQTSKIKDKKQITEFDPLEILHLSRNRVADEVHGTSMIESLEPIILARNEAMADFRIVNHRYVKPMRVWHVDTDDPIKIAEFKSLVDDATNKSENTIIPKGTVEHELVSVPQNATLSPLAWIRELNNYFFQSARVPQIIVGNSVELTEASAKIAYLAFQQTIEEEQLYIEEQLLAQIFIEINLEFPASLENELLSDQRKDRGSMNFQPNDTTAGIGQ